MALKCQNRRYDGYNQVSLQPLSTNLIDIIMFGTIAGGTMAIGGALYNAIAGSQMAKKREEMFNRADANADNSYYASLGRNKALMENALGRSRDAIVKGIKNVNNTSGVTGGDPNAVGKLQEQYLETASREASQGAQAVLAADAQAEQLRSQQKQNVINGRMQAETEKMKNTAEAAGQVAKVGAQMAISDIQKGLNTKSKAKDSQMGEASKPETTESVIESAVPDAPIEKSAEVPMDVATKPEEYMALNEEDDMFGLKNKKKGYWA